MKCKLKFYFAYVLGLDENVEVGDEFSGKDLGTFIHGFLKEVFKSGLKKESVIEESFEKKFLENLEKTFDNYPALEFREDSFLIKEVVIYKMKDFLGCEKKRDYVEVFECEKIYETDIKTQTGEYKLKCIIDRIDKDADGKYILLDYKTGNNGSPTNAQNINKMFESEDFTRENIKKAVSSLQLALYKYIFERSQKDKKVSLCMVYNIKKSDTFDFIANKVKEDKEKIYEVCTNIIKQILDEINSGDYFEFDENDIDECPNCKFSYICR
jgi:ATP-dependent exoDNAse (exonuclease V) beta subunit